MFVIFFLGPDLYIGFIMDSFNLFGNIPSARDKSIECVMMLGIALKICLMRNVGIPSGPAERFGFSLSIIFIIMLLFTCVKLKVGWTTCGRKSLTLSVAEIALPSFVPISLKKLLNWLDIAFLLVISYPSTSMTLLIDWSSFLSLPSYSLITVHGLFLLVSNLLF